MKRRSVSIAVLLLVCLLLGPRLLRQSAVVRLDRTHDLISLMERAEFSPGSIYGERKVATVEADDNRDRLAYIRMPTGTSATWRSLATNGHATLAFGIGVAWQGDGVEERAVRFRIEGHDETAQGGAEWLVLFERVRSPADLPAPALAEEYSVELPGSGDARWTLRLSTAAAEGGPVVKWPGWFSPRLSSAGRQVLAADHPLPLDHIVLDLTGGLGEAEIIQENPACRVARAVLDTAVGIAGAGGRRTSIRAAAPARVRYRLTPPAGAVLRFAYGVDTETGWQLPGDGMVFAVEISGERVFESALDAHNKVSCRGWKAATIALERWAGRPVALDLVTEPLGDAQNDVGGFAGALVSRSDLVERLTATEAPTVLLVLVDTLRADRLGRYGNRDGLTPRLDAMAGAGVLFRDARTVTSWTWPTVATVFTGLYPNTHGVHSDAGFFLIDGFETVAERFAGAGFTTGAFISNLLIGAADNYQQGFETFVQTPYANARAINERLLAWIDNTEGLARFAYVHYFDPHDPYLPPAPFLPAGAAPADGAIEQEIVERLGKMYARGEVDRTLVDQWMGMRWPLYDAEVRYFDTAFGELLDALEQRGVLDNCVIAFTSDHGEEFYEHGLIDHGGHLYDETVAVPLWITGYGGAALEPRTVTTPVEIRGLMATLSRLAGVSAAGGIDAGTDLLAGMRPGAVFGHTCHGVEEGRPGWTVKYSIIRNGWKLIHTPATDRGELYHLESDPAELHDRIAAEPAISAALKKELLAWLERTREEGSAARVEMDREAVRMMAELGYTGR